MKTRMKILVTVILLIAVIIATLNFPVSAVSMPTVSILSVPLITLPKAPTDLNGTAWINLAMNWQVKLNWKDNSNNETSFKIYRMTSGSVVKIYKLVDTVAANTTTYTDLTVELGKTYYYYVAASNTAGDSASATVCKAVSDTAPKAPTNLTAVADSQTNPTKVTINWKDQSNNESGFSIYRRESGSAANKSVFSTAANIVTYTDSDIGVGLEGLIYIYTVTAFNDFDVAAADCSVSFLLKAPSDLVASVQGTSVDLTWKDNSAKESYYAVYRCTDGSSYQLLAGTGHNTSYHDTNLTPNTLYYYGVAAVYESDPQLGSQNVYTTAKTDAAASSQVSVSASSQSASSQASSSVQVSSAPVSSGPDGVSSIASQPSAAQSNPMSGQQTDFVTQSEIESTVVTVSGETSAANQQEEKTVMKTMVEAIQQHSLIIIGVFSVIVLILVVLLLSRNKLRKK